MTEKDDGHAVAAFGIHLQLVNHHSRNGNHDG
jgi:hypothetical protein